MTIDEIFGKAADKVAKASGHPATFIGACLVISIWGLSGPVFRFSDTWQLIINTGTTIITFLMVFLIQNTQNRDNAALQIKIDELIRASEARNAFIGIEQLSQTEAEALRHERSRAEETTETSEKDIVQRTTRKPRRSSHHA